MDEATANIDLQTESIIQQLMKDNFENSTVITIAHRLNTILSSDRILVLSNGEVAEFDSPEVLKQNESSLLNSLLKDANN